MTAVIDAVVAAPISFIVGVIVGLGLSSRYRITRRPDANDRR